MITIPIIKVKQTKETVEEQTQSREKATEEKIQARLNAYKENRQKRLNERKAVKKASSRTSLQEITNDAAEKIGSPTIEQSEKDFSKENSVDGSKLKELAENFRNRNLEYLGLR